MYQLNHKRLAVPCRTLSEVVKHLSINKEEVATECRTPVAAGGDRLNINEAAFMHGEISRKKAGPIPSHMSPISINPELADDDDRPAPIPTLPGHCCGPTAVGRRPLGRGMGPTGRTLTILGWLAFAPEWNVVCRPKRSSGTPASSTGPS